MPLPRRSIPDKTSSVVEVTPNMFVIVLAIFSSFVRLPLDAFVSSH
jgi:hypothetical protein